MHSAAANRGTQMLVVDRAGVGQRLEEPELDGNGMVQIDGAFRVSYRDRLLA